MLPNAYPSQACSIARALEVVGERWTLLILRDAFLGTRRFDDFRASLGIASSTLSARLERLTGEGLLERHRYGEHSERFEYHLTRKAHDLWPAMVGLVKWGDRYYAPQGPPRVLQHKECGGEIDDRRICERCGKHLQPADVRTVPGPGAPDSGTPRGVAASATSG